jgi:hypothetical protein
MSQEFTGKFIPPITVINFGVIFKLWITEFKYLLVETCAKTVKKYLYCEDFV